MCQHHLCEFSHLRNIFVQCRIVSWSTQRVMHIRAAKRTAGGESSLVIVINSVAFDPPIESDLYICHPLHRWIDMSLSYMFVRYDIYLVEQHLIPICIRIHRAVLMTVQLHINDNMCLKYPSIYEGYYRQFYLCEIMNLSHTRTYFKNPNWER